MRKLILRISTSIDGFIEGANGKLDFAKSRSPEGAAWVAEKIAGAGAHLMGRKAFCEMATVMPAAPGAMAKSMNEIPKIVFSKLGFDPSQVTDAKGWADAQVITGDLAHEIAKLKRQPGKDLIAHGGVQFAQSLVETGLIDEYCIAMHPLASGSGAGLFTKLPKPIHLKLIDTKSFPTGAMAHIYRPE